jgi:hypothetical protein
MLLIRFGSESHSVKAILRHYAYCGKNEASVVLSYDGDNQSLLGLNL